MENRERIWIVATLLLVATLSLSAVAVAAWMPVHKPHIRTTDAVDSDIPPDYDAVLLTGDRIGDVYVVNLVVAGIVQPGYYYGPIPMEQYWVTLQTKRPSTDDRASYGMQYVNGVEENYNTPTERNGSTLTFNWPLEWIMSGYYIVSLEGALFSESSEDYIYEEQVENMSVTHSLTLPFTTQLVVVAGAVLCGTAFVAFVSIESLKRKQLRTS